MKFFSSYFNILFFLVIFFLFSGCDSVPNPFSLSPEATVKQFYQHLIDGELSKAKEMYDSQARQVVESPEMALAGGFSNWANNVTANGSIKIKIIDSQIRGEGSLVNYEIYYKDGSSTKKSVPLTKENGTWKIGLIR